MPEQKQEEWFRFSMSRIVHLVRERRASIKGKGSRVIFFCGYDAYEEDLSDGGGRSQACADCAKYAKDPLPGTKMHKSGEEKKRGRYLRKQETRLSTIGCATSR